MYDNDRRDQTTFPPLKLSTYQVSIIPQDCIETDRFDDMKGMIHVRELQYVLKFI